MESSPEMKRTSLTGTRIIERLIALTLRSDRKDKAEPDEDGCRTRARNMDPGPGESSVRTPDEQVRSQPPHQQVLEEQSALNLTTWIT